MTIYRRRVEPYCVVGPDVDEVEGNLGGSGKGRGPGLQINRGTTSHGQKGHPMDVK